MRPYTWLFGLLCLISGLHSGVAQNDPSFAVFAPQTDPAGAEVLFRTLVGDNEDLQVIWTSTLQEAISSEAEVLVLVLNRMEEPTASEDALEDLKSRKIIGIGYGAAQVFHQLGLEIRGESCAHFSYACDLTIAPQSCELLGDLPPMRIKPFDLSSGGESSDGPSAVYAHPKSPLCDFVDIVARFSDDVRAAYAPIVCQGNCLLSGLAAPATRWTPEYRAFFHQIAEALLARPLQPFATAEWTITEPGTYDFVVANHGNLEELSGRVGVFRFTEPTAFSARLEHRGSSNMMLLFMGRRDRLHWTRENGGQGETVEIHAMITEEDIERTGDEYWTLTVTNFDKQSFANCRLTINY